jgi:hypothetical protein
MIGLEGNIRTSFLRFMRVYLAAEHDYNGRQRSDGSVCGIWANGNLQPWAFPGCIKPSGLFYCDYWLFGLQLYDGGSNQNAAACQPRGRL